MNHSDGSYTTDDSIWSYTAHLPPAIGKNITTAAIIIIIPMFEHKSTRNHQLVFVLVLTGQTGIDAEWKPIRRTNERNRVSLMQVVPLCLRRCERLSSMQISVGDPRSTNIRYALIVDLQSSQPHSFFLPFDALLSSLRRQTSAGEGAGRSQRGKSTSFSGPALTSSSPSCSANP